MLWVAVFTAALPIMSQELGTACTLHIYCQHWVVLLLASLPVWINQSWNRRRLIEVPCRSASQIWVCSPMKWCSFTALKQSWYQRESFSCPILQLLKLYGWHSGSRGKPTAALADWYCYNTYHPLERMSTVLPQLSPGCSVKEKYLV